MEGKGLFLFLFLFYFILFFALNFFPLGDQNIWKKLFSSVNLTNFTLTIKKFTKVLKSQR